MDSTNMEQFKRECYEAIGAIDAMTMLKEELELRLDEARDNCVCEVLDNIIALVDAQISEYRRRKNDLCIQEKEST